jgi:2-polyprenyl-6-methoxyphenol hydroxylase-like FAD-dependent oxidoreductase
MTKPRRSKLSVLIRGAGIAGTALAWWLSRAGHDVTVVERADSLRPGGYKIDLRGAAVGVLDRMQLYDVVAAAHVRMKSATLVDPCGRRLATIDGDLYGMREGRDIELLRGDLARILYEAGSDGAEYRFSESITSLKDEGDEVAVTFRRGLPRAFDFVVAADGLHSPVREMYFGPEEHFLKYLGFHVAIYSVPNRLGLSHGEMACVLPGKRVANFYTSDATGNGKALFFFPSPRLDLAGTDATVWKRWLREYMLKDIPEFRAWIVPQLLADSIDATDFYFDALAQISMKNWSSGRVFLLGDAAWCASPASGQGCNLALVGAYTLAQALSGSLESYEERMRPFVLRNQQIAEGFDRMLPHSRAAWWLQKQATRLMAFKLGQDLLLRGARRRFRLAANGIEID